MAGLSHVHSLSALKVKLLFLDDYLDLQSAPSGMRSTASLLKRSAWKGPNIVPLPIVRPKNPGDKVPPIKTQARAATILPNFVGLRFQVYNGKIYHEVTITDQMVGHKLGEFSPTRKPFKPPKGT